MILETANRIVAIGSSHGDDQAAWRLIERLQDRPEINAGATMLTSPSQLSDYVDGCDRLIVVDACVGSGSPGTTTRFEWPDRRINQLHAHSTHGIGIADVLRLIETLERLPRQVVLFGIELAQCQPGALISKEVEHALDVLEEKVVTELRYPVTEDKQPKL